MKFAFMVSKEEFDSLFRSGLNEGIGIGLGMTAGMPYQPDKSAGLAAARAHYKHKSDFSDTLKWYSSVFKKEYTGEKLKKALAAAYDDPNSYEEKLSKVYSAREGLAEAFRRFMYPWRDIFKYVGEGIDKMAFISKDGLCLKASYNGCGQIKKEVETYLGCGNTPCFAQLYDWDEKDFTSELQEVCKSVDDLTEEEEEEIFGKDYYPFTLEETFVMCEILYGAANGGILATTKDERLDAGRAEYFPFEGQFEFSAGEIPMYSGPDGKPRRTMYPLADMLVRRLKAEPKRLLKALMQHFYDRRRIHVNGMSLTSAVKQKMYAHDEFWGDFQRAMWVFNTKATPAAAIRQFFEMRRKNPSLAPDVVPEFDRSRPVKGGKKNWGVTVRDGKTMVVVIDSGA